MHVTTSTCTKVPPVKEWKFLGLKPGVLQHDGFFVDDNDRIFFWPTKEGPGYELSLEEALKRAYPKFLKPRKEYPAKFESKLRSIFRHRSGWIAAIVLVPLHLTFHHLTTTPGLSREVGEYFSKVGLATFLVSALLSTFIPLFPAAYLFRKLKKNKHPLPKSIRVIRKESPPPLFLSSEALMGQKETGRRSIRSFIVWVSMIIGLLSLSWFLGVHPSDPESMKQGDRYTYLYTGFTFSVVLSFLYFISFKARSAISVGTYPKKEFESALANIEAAQPVVHAKPGIFLTLLVFSGLSVHVLLKAVLSWWGLASLFLAFLIYGSLGFYGDYKSTPLVDARGLTNQACQSLFQQNPTDHYRSCRDVPNDHVIRRWDRIPTIQFNTPSPLEDDTLAELAKFYDIVLRFFISDLPLPPSGIGNVQRNIVFHLTEDTVSDPPPPVRWWIAKNNDGTFNSVGTYIQGPVLYLENIVRTQHYTAAGALGKVWTGPMEVRIPGDVGVHPAKSLIVHILYDQRLRPGMSAEQAIPIIRTIASEIAQDREPEETYDAILLTVFSWYDWVFQTLEDLTDFQFFDPDRG